MSRSYGSTGGQMREKQSRPYGCVRTITSSRHTCGKKHESGEDIGVTAFMLSARASIILKYPYSYM